MGGGRGKRVRGVQHIQCGIEESSEGGFGGRIAVRTGADFGWFYTAELLADGKKHALFPRDFYTRQEIFRRTDGGRTPSEKEVAFF